MGFALSAALKGPLILRAPAAIAGAAFTAKLAFDSIHTINDCIPVLQQVWHSDPDLHKNREAIAQRLGPLAFKVLSAHVVAKATPRLFEFGSRIPGEMKSLTATPVEFGPRLGRGFYPRPIFLGSFSRHCALFTIL